MLSPAGADALKRYKYVGGGATPLDNILDRVTVSVFFFVFE